MENKPSRHRKRKSTPDPRSREHKRTIKAIITSVTNESLGLDTQAHLSSSRKVTQADLSNSMESHFSKGDGVNCTSRSEKIFKASHTESEKIFKASHKSRTSVFQSLSDSGRESKFLDKESHAPRPSEIISKVWEVDRTWIISAGEPDNSYYSDSHNPHLGPRKLSSKAKSYVPFYLQ